MHRRTPRRLVVGAAVALLVVLCAVAVSHVHRGGVRVTASSTSAGTDPAGLVSPRGNARSPDLAVRPVTWRSDGGTIGAWVELHWPKPTRADHVELLAAGKHTPAPTSALLTFDGGPALMLTANASGDVVLDFPTRTTSSVRVTVAGAPPGATSVGLAALVLDDSSPDRTRARGPAVVAVTASSSASSSPSALADGDMRAGDLGAEWRADPSDAAPWAQLSWVGPREVSAVQVFGPGETAPSSGAAALHGVLRFSDGSSVVVSGIAGGGGPTTLAFAPRLVTSVRLQLSRTVPDAVVGLREVVVYDAGTTPVRWPSTGTGYSVTPRPESCDAGSPAVAQPTDGRITLICPTPGSAVSGQATVVVAAPAGTALSATTWKPTGDGSSGAVARVASASAGADGHATLSFPTTSLPRGPITVAVSAPSGSATAVDVQLVNQSGLRLPSPGFAPRGMTLQWDDEFERPLAVSATGSGATYAATKPAGNSGSGFGEALFADPAAGAENLATVAGQYLRLRVRPLGDLQVDNPYGQTSVGAILSSVAVGGAGFAAQYGYFEARMMGAPDPGTWPAFWMLNTESATADNQTSGEVDAVELYGHDPLGSCHSTHSWGNPDADHSGAAKCLAVNGFPDWTMTWHTYGVRIYPGGAAFSIDGVQVATADQLSHTGEPFFFLLDLALGGGWPLDLAPTGGISDLYIDWVHVYT